MSISQTPMIHRGNTFPCCSISSVYGCRSFHLTEFFTYVTRVGKQLTIKTCPVVLQIFSDGLTYNEQPNKPLCLRGQCLSLSLDSCCCCPWSCRPGNILAAGLWSPLLHLGTQTPPRLQRSVGSHRSGRTASQELPWQLSCPEIKKHIALDEMKCTESWFFLLCR